MLYTTYCAARTKISTAVSRADDLNEPAQTAVRKELPAAIKAAAVSAYRTTIDMRDNHASRKGLTGPPAATAAPPAVE